MEKIRNGITGRYQEDGRVSYYLNGLLHREDGPAREFDSGDTLWFLFDKLHRIDGPAVEWADGTKRWYVNGKLHREDGPAVEYPDGREFWWFEGVNYPSKDVFPGSRVKIIHSDLLTLTDEQLEEVANIVQEMISLRQSHHVKATHQPRT